MKVEFLKQFSKDLDKLNTTAIKKQIEYLIENLESVENLDTISNIKKLKGHRSAYRIRIGDYRLGLFVEGKTVTFARILHRKDIYKQFP